MGPTRVRLALLALLTITYAKIILGLTVAAISPAATGSGQAFPLSVYVAHVLAFGAAGVLLLAAGRRDPRAYLLGVTFALTASSFSDRLLVVGASVRSAWGETTLTALASLHVYAFLPYFAWRFFQRFPRVSLFGAPARLATQATMVSLVVGWILFGVNLLLWIAPSEQRPALLRVLARGEPRSLYWPILFTLSGLALLFAGWKTRRAQPEERRRVGILVTGLVVGITPIIVFTLLYSFAPTSRLLSSPDVLRATGLLVYPALLSVPITTAYAVLVRRALDVRLVIRRAIRYALARHAVLWATALPFGVLVAVLYLNRRLPLAELFSGVWAAAVLGAGLLGLVVARLRGPAIEAVDRVFFRDQYDARAVLSGLIRRIPETERLGDLGPLLTREIDRAIHVERIGFMYLRPSERAFVSPHGEVRSLSSDSGLARILGRSSGVVEASLEEGGALERLGIEDQQWVADSGYHLLVPLRTPAGRLVGLLGLGEKRSELPYTLEDRELLEAIAATAGLRVEAQLTINVEAHPAVHPAPVSAPQTDDTPAYECPNCGRIEWPTRQDCPECGTPLETGPVPVALAGKYRLTSRIGRGGMGVVYLARDLNLGRQVAIKTLPRVDPRTSARLRREARAMAAVSHPNLAMILAAESWRSTPFLIFEYLPGGTLADRLERGPAEPLAAIALVSTLAAAVERIHSAGMLHRDIKPTNIGFAADGTPKLLDFGLVHLASVREQDLVARRDTEEWSWPASGDPGSLTGEGEVLGTVHYMSPEALAGDPPGPGLDVWSLNMVLYECVAGRNPLSGLSLVQTVGRLSSGALPDVRTFAPEVPPELSGYLTAALSPIPAERPASIREMRSRFQRFLGTSIT